MCPWTSHLNPSCSGTLLWTRATTKNERLIMASQMHLICKPYCSSMQLCEKRFPLIASVFAGNTFHKLVLFFGFIWLLALFQYCVWGCMFYLVETFPSFIYGRIRKHSPIRHSNSIMFLPSHNLCIYFLFHFQALAPQLQYPGIPGPIYCKSRKPLSKCMNCV